VTLDSEPVVQLSTLKIKNSPSMGVSSQYGHVHIEHKLIKALASALKNYLCSQLSNLYWPIQTTQ